MILQIPDFLLSLGAEGLLSIIGVIIPCWAVLMITLERLYPYTQGIKLFRRGFWIDLVWYTIIQSKIMEIVIFYWIILNLKNSMGLANFGPLSDWNYWGLILLFFITHDFYIYWFHRLQHNNRWFWRTHEAHHSVRDVDWLAGSRSHFLEILINQTIEFAPIFILLDSYTAAYVYPVKAMLDALWGMWIHANINVKSGKLQYIINGPEMHQWHHANHEEVFYKNYCTKLAIWDWLFGTGYLPGLKPLSFALSKPQFYGLPYAYPIGFIGQTIHSIKRFDFQKFELASIYNHILTFRRKATQQFLMLYGVRKVWIDREIFDAENKKYDLDNMREKCSTCHQLLKYFYRGKNLVFVCENCDKNTDNLDKFN